MKKHMRKALAFVLCMVLSVSTLMNFTVYANDAAQINPAMYDSYEGNTVSIEDITLDLAGLFSVTGSPSYSSSNESVTITELEELELIQMSFESHNLGSYRFAVRSDAIASLNNIEDIVMEEIAAVGQARPLMGSDFFISVPGFITQQGQIATLPLQLFPGEVLHVQMDSPNLASIDYDLYLFEVDPWGDLHLIDVSETTTFINGAHGTLPETVGVINNTGTTRNLLIAVASFMGASDTLPFILNVGINTEFDSWEVDSIRNPVHLNIGNTGGIISVRRLNTRADGDWFSFVVPVVRDYDVIHLSLDTASANAGHVVELYTFQNGQARRVNLNSLGNANVTAGTHFIRVAANGQLLTHNNYELSIIPQPRFVPPTTITRTSVTGWQESINWPHGRMPLVFGGSTLTVTGRVTGAGGVGVPNTSVTLNIFNDSWQNPDLANSIATAMTDANGNFSVSVRVASGVGIFSFFNPGSGLIHRYDLGMFILYVTNQSNLNIIHPIYIHAFASF